MIIKIIFKTVEIKENILLNIFLFLKINANKPKRLIKIGKKQIFNNRFL